MVYLSPVFPLRAAQRREGRFMGDLYRTVKRLPLTALKDHGFKTDRLREGFYKQILSSGGTAIFHITGIWSHVSLACGIRFGYVNKLLYQSALAANWHKDKASLFDLELVGLFEERLGDYCEAEGDIGVYCPDGSTVTSQAEIVDVILNAADRMADLGNLDRALIYMCDHSLFEPFGCYMIPAAAKICGRKDIWDWSVSHFASSVGSNDRSSYIALIERLEKG